MHAHTPRERESACALTDCCLRATAWQVGRVEKLCARALDVMVDVCKERLAWLQGETKGAGGPMRC